MLAGGLGRRLPTSFVPEEDYGYFLLNVQLPDAASLQRTDAVCRKIEAILAKTDGLGALQRDRRLQPADPRHGAEQRLLLRQLEAVGRARRRAGRAVDRQPAQRHVPPGDSRGGRLRRDAAVDPGPRLAGRLHASGCRIGPAARSSNLDAALQKFLDRGAQAARARRRELAVQRRRAADLRRRRPRQGAEAGHRAHRRLPDAADVPRRAVREPVQPLRPAVARLPAGRRAGAHAARRTSASSTSATTTATWCRCRRCSRRGRSSAREYTNRFNLYRAAQVTGAPAPGYSSGQALDALEEVAKATLPPEISYDWSDLSYQERKAAGNAGAALRAVDRLRVPDPGGALRELVAAVLRPAVGAGRGRRRLRRAADAAVRLRRLRPGRRRHADRPGREERDPDRRVREGAQRRGEGRWSTPRSKARSCGCGRS